MTPAAERPGARAPPSSVAASGESLSPCLTLMALAGVVAVAWFSTRSLFERGQSAAVPVGTNIVTSSLILGGDGLAALALSPDGHTLVYAASSAEGTRLYLRRLDRPGCDPTRWHRDASAPFFSPDGASIGFFAGDRLKRVNLDGRAPAVVCDAPSARGGTWGADGRIIFSRRGELVRVQATGGVAEVVLSKADPNSSTAGRTAYPVRFDHFHDRQADRRCLQPVPRRGAFVAHRRRGDARLERRLRRYTRERAPVVRARDRCLCRTSPRRRHAAFRRPAADRRRRGDLAARRRGATYGISRWLDRVPAGGGHPRQSGSRVGRRGGKATAAGVPPGSSPPFDCPPIAGVPRCTSPPKTPTSGSMTSNEGRSAG